jgi:hypothetical protein
VLISEGVSGPNGSPAPGRARIHSNRHANTAEIETIYGGNQDWLLETGFSS